MNTTLGSTVEDKITGFTGVVTGRVEYITGCNQLLVQPRIKLDGDFIEPRWIDEDRVTVSNREPVTLNIGNPGFDKPAPRR